MQQLNIFDVLTADGVNKKDAPVGFYAVLKTSATTPNICNSCDARMLCQENKDDWCLRNRCMDYEITAFKDGKAYKRQDGKSVIFKRI
jgi:hypothetical protein